MYFFLIGFTFETIIVQTMRHFHETIVNVYTTQISLRILKLPIDYWVLTYHPFIYPFLLFLTYDVPRRLPLKESMLSSILMDINNLDQYKFRSIFLLLFILSFPNIALKKRWLWSICFETSRLKQKLLSLLFFPYPKQHYIHWTFIEPHGISPLLWYINTLFIYHISFLSKEFHRGPT